MKSRIDKLEWQLAQRGVGKKSLKGWTPVYTFRFDDNFTPLTEAEIARAVATVKAKGGKPHIIRREGRWLEAEDAMMMGLANLKRNAI